MATLLKLDQSAISEHIPHRFENLLLDSIEVDREKFDGALRLFIGENDPLNRQLFAQNLDSGQRVIMSAMAMEIVALASIVTAGQIPPGYLAFFAMISNYSRSAHILLNDATTGTVSKIKDRGGFLSFRGELKNSQSNVICTGDVMAYYANVADGMPEGEKKMSDIPELTQNTTIDKSGWHKQPVMVFVDAIRHLAPDHSQVITQYTFSDQHPTAHGHFPGNPVMMGVFQWTAVEDAFSILAKEFKAAGKTGRFIAKGSARLISTSGHTVAECKEAAAELVMGTGPNPAYADILETRRFAFKHIVYPQDSFYTILDITEIAPV